MPIYPKKNEKTGKVEWTVRVSLTSKKDSSIRVQLKKKGVKNEVTAKKIEKSLFAEAHRKILKNEENGGHWRPFVERWHQAVVDGELLAKSMSHTALEDYICVLDKFTYEWNRLYLHEITRPMVWQLLAKVETEVSKQRMERLKSALTRVFEWGTLTGQINNLKESPTRGYQSLTKSEEKMPEILAIDEIRRLLKLAETLNHPWFPVWAAALLTGMRSGELFALSWKSVDFENEQIFVHQSWTNKTGIGPTKGKYWREIPINDHLMRILKKERLKRSQSEFVLPRFSEWEQGLQAQVLRQFCEETGIPSIKFHTLRSCFATQLMRDGVAPALVMKICGWKDFKTFQRYVRLAGIETKGATDSLKFLSEKEAVSRVSELFVQNGARKGPSSAND